MIRRGLRLELIAGLGIALALPALALAAENAPHLATQTTLTVETRDQGGRTQATVAVTVTGEDGLPATGAVAISDHGSHLPARHSMPRATPGMVLNLLPAITPCALSIWATPLTWARPPRRPGCKPRTVPLPTSRFPSPRLRSLLPPGKSGTIIASVTPVNASALTAPMFVTLSCSGLPDQSSCTFTPENVEILPNATDAVHQLHGHLHAGGILSVFKPPTPRLQPSRLGVSAARRAGPGRTGLGSPPPPLAQPALAAGPGWPGHHAGHHGLQPLYNYLNHGPPPNPATPAGTYTVTSPRNPATASPPLPTPPLWR